MASQGCKKVDGLDGIMHDGMMGQMTVSCFIPHSPVEVAKFIIIIAGLRQKKIFQAGSTCTCSSNSNVVDPVFGQDARTVL